MVDEFDVIIVGAGPAGSSAARKLAQMGLSVMVYDRRAEMGNPKRCGEGLEKKAEQLIGPIPARCIAQRIKGARIYAPNGKHLDAVAEDGGYVLERHVFDKWLATEAAKAGADVRVNALVRNLIIEDGFVKGVAGECLGEPFEARAKLVMAATGAESPLSRQAGLKTACALNLVDTCFQYEMAGIDLDQSDWNDFIHIYIGSGIAPRGYAWVFPKGNTTGNVGIGVVPGAENPKAYLDRWIGTMPGIRRGAVMETNAGCVPVGGLLKDMVSDGFIVCGEAAHHVNPIHGGGIKEAIGRGDVSRKSLSRYNDVWWSVRGNHMRNVEKVREVFEKMSDMDYNDLVDVLKPGDIIEFARGSKLSVLAGVLAKKPGLARLALHLI
jgi:digeranylgeranylglycerophospholipid reductase